MGHWWESAYGTEIRRGGTGGRGCLAPAPRRQLMFPYTDVPSLEHGHGAWPPARRPKLPVWVGRGIADHGNGGGPHGPFRAAQPLGGRKLEAMASRPSRAGYRGGMIYPRCGVCQALSWAHTPDTPSRMRAAPWGLYWHAGAGISNVRPGGRRRRGDGEVSTVAASVMPAIRPAPQRG